MEGKLKKKYILPVLYDVRPVDSSGRLDVEKISRIKSVLDLKKDYQLVDYQPSKNILTIQPKKSGEKQRIKLELVRPKKAKPVRRPKPVLAKAKKKETLRFERRDFLPSREQILKELEEFNRTDNLLSLVSQAAFEDFDFIKQPKQKSAKSKKKKISKPVLAVKAEPQKKQAIDLEKTPLRRPLAETPGAGSGPAASEQIELESPADWGKGPSVFEKEFPAGPESGPDEISQEDLFRVEEFYFPEAANPEADEGFNPLGVKLVGQDDYPANHKLAAASFSLPRTWPKKKNWSKSLGLLRPGQLPKSRSFFGFILTGFLIALVIPLAAWLGQGMIAKQEVMSNSLSAYQNLLEAKTSLQNADWQKAGQDFAFAHNDFSQAYAQVKDLGGLVLDILGKLPGGNGLSSGAHLIKVGEHLTSGGHLLVSALNDLSLVNFFEMTKIPQEADLADYSAESLISDRQASLTDSIVQSRQQLEQALLEVRSAIQEAEKVEVRSLPAEIQDKVAMLKQDLPKLEGLLVQAFDFSGALLEILGHQNPRQYLLVFQNNSELRATGGFVGTYGLLQFDQGRIRKLLVDGVYNIDGQLHEKVIPPQPIQKISTAWSMHDANWFPDFPTSAEKIQWFYEKAGGVTTDGVWAVTPVLIERLLELTGPIAMPEYQVELDSNNFTELMQYKVEVDYDKRLNRPKKILADFTPLFLNALANLSLEDKTKAIEIIFEALEQKQILFYFNDPELEKLVVEQGWSGQLQTTQGDYLSVVSSNINGYKTDRMIDESIDLVSEIQSDGSIINTLTITREHLGGGEEYDWWNRVNSNYLRVYLPKGSQLISARGHTIEAHSPPIDYQENGFRADGLVSQIEANMRTDPKTGTHIFEENNKTVFGNWVYVSPGRKVVVTYQYRLPFKIGLTELPKSYSILIQKQAGSLGSNLEYQLVYPPELSLAWAYPEELDFSNQRVDYRSDLSVDRFLGMTFGAD